MGLSIIIVNYNGASHLEKCLESVYAGTGTRPLEVIVVDNASEDESREILAAKFPQVRVIASPENLGFARANNLALGVANGDSLLFLNNDTIVPPGSIDNMLRILGERPEVGALGPLTRNEDGSVQISTGRTLSFRHEACQKFLVWSHTKGCRLVRWFVERRSRIEAWPGWVSGACLMTRAELLRELGGMDGHFFLYNEDVDLCHRIRMQGCRILYTPQAEIVHFKGKSVEKSGERVALEYRRSQLYFYEKYYGRGKVRLLKVYLLSRLIFGWFLGGRSQRPRFARLIRLVWEY